MAKTLNHVAGEMVPDQLIAGMTPPPQTASGTIAKLSTAATYKRGTVLAKSAKDNSLCILGTTAASGDTLTPDCILCDDTEVGTEAGTAAAVYVMGRFNVDALSVADSYTMTEADKDKLRERGIYLAQVWD